MVLEDGMEKSERIVCTREELVSSVSLRQVKRRSDNSSGSMTVLIYGLFISVLSADRMYGSMHRREKNGDHADIVLVRSTSLTPAQSADIRWIQGKMSCKDIIRCVCYV